MQIRSANQFVYVSPGAMDELHMAARLSFRSWEPRSRALFSRLAKKSTRVLDIGGYSGVYALTAALANRNSYVDVFEPNPNMVDQIQENIRINGLTERITLHEIALSDADGTAALLLSHESATAGIASLRYEPHLHPINANSDVVFRTRSLPVAVRKLDTLVLPPVDLIKIDVEGNEPLAFAGAALTLQRDQPIILSEALDATALVAQQEILRKFGYLSPIRIDPDGQNGDNCHYLWSTARRLPILESTLREDDQRSPSEDDSGDPA